MSDHVLADEEIELLEQTETESEPETDTNMSAKRTKKTVTIQTSSSEDEEDERTGEHSPINTPTYRQQLQYHLYPWRWFMLAALCLLNVSNGTMWLSFAPIPDITADFYNISISQVDWFSIIYFIASLVIGLLSIFVLDTFGLKVSIYLGASLNLIGSLLRYVSTFHPIVCSSVFDKSGFLVAMIGQFLTACAQPFILYAPTMLAGTWFGTKERAICTNFASIANPVGLAVAQLVSPYVADSAKDLPMLLWIYAIPAGLAAILNVVAFWWSRPSIPPAPSADVETVPFFKGIWLTIKNWNFWILLITWGVGAGLFNAILTLLPQILCPFGYSDKDSGLWGALMIFCGMAGATIAGLVIDFTKWYKDVAVVAFTMAILCFIWFYEVFSLHDQEVNIAISLCFFGFFALPLIPASMELGVEITYPVSEATSSGVLWSVAQIAGILLVLFSQVLQFDIDPDLKDNARCSTSDSSAAHLRPSCFVNSSQPVSSSGTPQNLSHAIELYISLMVFVFILFVALFWPRYKRLEDEKKADFEASVYMHNNSNSRNSPLAGSQ